MTAKHIYLVIAIIILTCAVFYPGLEEVTGALQKANPLTIGFLFFLQIGTLGLIAYRWFFLLKKTNHRISFGRVFTINMAGNYIESVTPSVKAGGEAAKVYLLHRHTSCSYAGLAGIMLTIKYYSLIPFIILTGFFMVIAFLRYELPLITIPAFLGLVVFFLIIALIHHRGGKSGKKASERQPALNKKYGINMPFFLQKIFRVAGNKAEDAAGFVRSAAAHSRNPVTLPEQLILLSISVLIWVLYPAKVYLVANMLGINVDPVTITIITFTAYLTGLIPLLPGGLGVFEGSMVLMFVLTGFDAAEGLAVTLLSRLVTFWFPLLVSAGAASFLAMIQPAAKPESDGPAPGLSRN